MSELNPCPFNCVNPAQRPPQSESETMSDHLLPTDLWTVHCGYCGARGPICDTEELAIEAWNQCTSPWINVNIRLPNSDIDGGQGGPEGSWGLPVLAYQDQWNSVIAYFDYSDDKFWVNGDIINPQWWAPKPLPPKMISIK